MVGVSIEALGNGEIKNEEKDKSSSAILPDNVANRFYGIFLHILTFKVERCYGDVCSIYNTYIRRKVIEDSGSSSNSNCTNSMHAPAPATNSHTRFIDLYTPLYY